MIENESIEEAELIDYNCLKSIINGYKDELSDIKKEILREIFK